MIGNMVYLKKKFSFVLSILVVVTFVFNSIMASAVIEIVDEENPDDIKTVYILSRYRTTITIDESYVHTGDEVKPVPKVEYTVNEVTTELVEGIDYTIEYVNNVDVGEATLYIKGIDNYIGSLGQKFNITHDYKSSVTKEPTCTEEGVRTYTCSVCGDSYTEAIEKIAHNYVETVVAPTATEQGYTLHKCSVCGDSYKDNYVDPIDVPVVRPKYIKSTISLEGVIGANLEYKISDTYVNGNYKIEVTAVSDKGDTKELTFDKNEKVGTNYKVVLPVTSSELTNVYDVTLAVKDANENVITSVTNKVTVNATLNQMRSDEEVGPLARALQTYGTYAQKYFGVGTTDPTEEPDDISGITNEDLAAYKLSQQAVTTGKKVKFGTQSLLLEDQTTIRVTLASVPTTVDVNKLEMVYTGGGKEGRTEVKYDANTGKYYADISNISAQELSVMYSIHMEEAGEQVSNNLSYGAYSFIEANVSSNDVNYSNALKALYNYGEVAKAYFG